VIGEEKKLKNITKEKTYFVGMYFTCDRPRKITENVKKKRKRTSMERTALIQRVTPESDLSSSTSQTLAYRENGWKHLMVALQVFNFMNYLP
jgi:hypothetical protein